MTRTAATKRKPNKKEESKLLADIRLAIGLRKDILSKRITTGVFKTMDGKRKVRSAPNGTADLEIVQARRALARETINPDGFSPHEREYILNYGQFIAVETKKPKNAEQRKAQEDYQRAVESVHGIYIVARSVQDVLDVLGPEPK